VVKDGLEPLAGVMLTPDGDPSRGAVLGGVGEIEQACFIEGAADALQSDRQPIT
jgi:hypothetical protein